MSGSSNSDESSGGESVLVTPYHKQMLLKPSLQPLNIDMPPSSDGDNRLASIKEDCESPLSSWDSEPETDIPLTINSYGNYLDVEEQNQFVGVENTDDNLLWEMDNRSYDELLKKFNEKVEELTISNFKLQLLEKEIIKLKANIQNSEGQLDNVRVELRMKGDELHKQKEISKKEIFKLKTCIEKSENQLDYVLEELKLKQDELQKQTAELDTHANLVEQLEAAHAKLKISKDENAMLRDELESKSSETYQLQGQLNVAQENMTKSNLDLVSGRKEIQMLRDLVRNKVIKYDTNETKHNQYVRKLKSEISDSQAKYSSDIASLSKIKINLTSKLEDCEYRNKVLENKLRRYKDEKLKQEEIHATQQMVLRDKIRYLMEERDQRMHESIGMIERDEVSKPDVFKSPNSETYPMFGEAKIEDLSSQLQTQAAQQFRMPDMGFLMAKQAQGDEADRAQPEEEEEVDETGVEAFGIELVMTQAGVSRSKAVKAIKTHNGDIVTAILELIY